MAQNQIETRLARIEERLIHMDEKLERYLESLSLSHERIDTKVNGLTKEINTHSEELVRNRKDHRWSAGIVSALFAVLIALIERHS